MRGLFQGKSDLWMITRGTPFCAPPPIVRLVMRWFAYFSLATPSGVKMFIPDEGPVMLGVSEVIGVVKSSKSFSYLNVETHGFAAPHLKKSLSGEPVGATSRGSLICS